MPPLEAPTRRELLALSLLSAGALLAGLPAHALGSSSQLDVAQLSLSRGTLLRPRAWERLLYEVIQTTSVEANPQAVEVGPESPELFAHPFAVLMGDSALPPLSDAAVEQLRRYLAYGGFLFIDDATGSRDGPFARSVRELVRRMFPTRPLAPLPGDHSLYRAFFLLERPYGRLARERMLEGVTLGPTTPLIYCANDLSGALDRTEDGRDRFPVVPGGSSQRREALKLGINLVMYSLTSNYKHDQAHVAELMREDKL
jgi:hypothetical protein